MRVPFFKMHSLGNDFVIIDQRNPELLHTFTEEQIQQIANRHLGIGCDQLFIISPSSKADCKMIIFNADGSRAGACGNGTRCVALLLAQEHITLEVEDKILTAIRLDNNTIEVDMGHPIYDWQKIPLRHEVEDILAIPLIPELPKGACINFGNPHVVFFIEDAAGIDLEHLGPILEHHPLFPQRVNVSMAQILDAKNIKLRTWERGAAETAACGSAACAAVTLGHHLGKLAKKAWVHLPHGQMCITVRVDGGVTMSGPATIVAQGELVL